MASDNLQFAHARVMLKFIIKYVYSYSVISYLLIYMNIYFICIFGCIFYISVCDMELPFPWGNLPKGLIKSSKSKSKSNKVTVATTFQSN